MRKDPINFVLSEQMGMVVANPTDEDFDMQFSGVSFTLKPGEKMTLATNAASHILNSYGPRGLCYLAYGADEDRILSEGVKRNEEFKRKQVEEFNVRNENRKNMNLGYIDPTDKIRKYAEQLGIELVKTYAPRDNGYQLKSQENEITSLKNTVAELTMLVNKLLQNKTESTPEPKEPDEPKEKQRGNPNWVKR